VQPQAKLRTFYSAADVLLLPSTREGWPNVVLEAMACGTPTVACDVGSVRDMIDSPSTGEVVRTRDATEFAQAMHRVYAHGDVRHALVDQSRRFDWPTIAQRHLQILQAAAAGEPAAIGALGQAMSSP
jgi:glycosyltransferase involved in cell wall biosynthesis